MGLKKKVKKRKAAVAKVEKSTLLSNEEAAKVLNTVVDALNRGGEGSHNLWSILSALRGPDSGDGDGNLKWKTTARIRGSIGLNSYHPDHDWSMSPAPYIVEKCPLGTLSLTDLRDQLKSTAVSWHFKDHYLLATVAIQNLLGYSLTREAAATKDAVRWTSTAMETLEDEIAKRQTEAENCIKPERFKIQFMGLSGSWYDSIEYTNDYSAIEADRIIAKQSDYKYRAVPYSPSKLA